MAIITRITIAVHCLDIMERSRSPPRTRLEIQPDLTSWETGATPASPAASRPAIPLRSTPETEDLVHFRITSRKVIVISPRKTSRATCHKAHCAYKPHLLRVPSPNHESAMLPESTSQNHPELHSGGQWTLFRMSWMSRTPSRASLLLSQPSCTARRTATCEQ